MSRLNLRKIFIFIFGTGLVLLTCVLGYFAWVKDGSKFIDIQYFQVVQIVLTVAIGLFFTYSLGRLNTIEMKKVELLFDFVCELERRIDKAFQMSALLFRNDAGRRSNLEFESNLEFSGISRQYSVLLKFQRQSLSNYLADELSVVQQKYLVFKAIATGKHGVRSSFFSADDQSQLDFHYRNLVDAVNSVKGNVYQ